MDSNNHIGIVMLFFTSYNYTKSNTTILSSSTQGRSYKRIEIWAPTLSIIQTASASQNWNQTLKRELVGRHGGGVWLDDYWHPLRIDAMWSGRTLHDATHDHQGSAPGRWHWCFTVAPLIWYCRPATSLMGEWSYWRVDPLCSLPE